ncbi:MAG: amidohydrolase family protein [Alphaproteobacteria bacterium]
MPYVLSSIRILTAVSLLILGVNVSHAESLGVDGAMKLPIVDTHFHIMDWMKIPKIKAKMKEHNVPLWGGTSPRGRFGDYQDKAEAYGERYIFATGTSQQLATFKKGGGTKAWLDANNPVFHNFLLKTREHLETGNVKVIGEYFVNTRTSTSIKWRRWKLKGDSSGMRAIFDLATEFNVPLMVHAQLDDDTAEELVRLAQSRPKGKLVLGHCGKDSTADEVRAVFQKAANITCNLAYRSPPQFKRGDKKIVIWDSSGIKKSWRKLIEEFPDRFMVGIDDTHDWGHFDAVVRTIRKNLLANLTPATAEKVANKNARRIYGL